MRWATFWLVWERILYCSRKAGMSASLLNLKEVMRWMGMLVE